MKYQCINCGFIDEDDVCQERIVDLEPMGDHKVERVSFFDVCGFCGSDDIEPIELGACRFCD